MAPLVWGNGIATNTVISSAKQLMTRKDSEKESERPHYYSQFWLDIAAGRRTIGGPKSEDEGELLDDAPEPIALRRPLRNEPDEDLDEDDEPVNTRRTTTVRSVAPVVSPDEEDVTEEPEDEEPLAADDSEDLTQDETVADADIPDMDFVADEDEDEDEEIPDDEEDEDAGWVAGRGRKKPSPKRPTKQPPVKRPKRDTRRSF